MQNSSQDAGSMGVASQLATPPPTQPEPTVPEQWSTLVCVSHWLAAFTTTSELTEVAHTSERTVLGRVENDLEKLLATIKLVKAEKEEQGN